MASVKEIFKVKEVSKQSFKTPDRQSPEAFEDYSIKKNVATREGTVEKVPVNDSDIVNKLYVAPVIASAHAQNTDTALGASCVALDHGAAATDMVINVCYGTSATPPTATDTTIGTLYIQYTA